MKNMTIRINDKLKEQLEKHSEKKDKSISRITRQSLNLFFKKEEEEKKSDHMQDEIKSINNMLKSLTIELKGNITKINKALFCIGQSNPATSKIISDIFKKN